MGILNFLLDMLKVALDYLEVEDDLDISEIYEVVIEPGIGGEVWHIDLYSRLGRCRAIIGNFGRNEWQAYHTVWEN